ncbi:hypothetical protein BV20DRAFT_943774 [Pilatotrama ljubarskyi]|nr:hypothetical protein BV20DRAFT_943774 [Pilatotrama ljubarskyi]
MPVTFSVSNVSPRDTGTPDALSNEGLLQESCGPQSTQCAEILQCSVTDAERPVLFSGENGFVDAVMQAYGGHHNLRIRPDDVWIAILRQLSFYVNAHAEELRKYFVPHEGQKDLAVETVGSRLSIDYGKLARTMTRLIQKNVMNWILPDFSTTTSKDTTISSKPPGLSTCNHSLLYPLRYFRHIFRAICGIPSVTLEGTKADWQCILDRLDRLHELGDEPSIWAGMLRPILRRFVSAFDGEPDVTFWSHVVHWLHVGCGEAAISGWLTAFCVWSAKGKWQGRTREYHVPREPHHERIKRQSAERIPRAAEGAFLSSAFETKGCALVSMLSQCSSPHSVQFCGGHPGRYPLPDHRRELIPAGYCEVDVIVNDNGTVFDCMMVAGHLAIAATASQPGGGLDTLAPAPQWFIFEKPELSRRAMLNVPTLDCAHLDDLL